MQFNIPQAENPQTGVKRRHFTFIYHEQQLTFKRGVVKSVPYQVDKNEPLVN